MYSELTRTAIIIGLTVCFETNFKEGNERKELKYSELVKKVERIDFVVDLITVEGRLFVVVREANSALSRTTAAHRNHPVLFMLPLWYRLRSVFPQKLQVFKPVTDPELSWMWSLTKF